MEAKSAFILAEFHRESAAKTNLLLAKINLQEQKKKTTNFKLTTPELEI